MTPAQTAAFEAGSGVSPDTLTTGIAGVVLVLVLLWVAWLVLGSFRAWQTGQRSLFELASTAIRGSIVLLVLGFYLH